MASLTWLHVSDLHLKGPPNGPEYNYWKENFERLVLDVKRAVRQLDLSVDLVFLTGDIAYKGSKEEFDSAKAHLDSLLAACGHVDPHEALFIVPGNHDVNWQKQGKMPALVVESWLEREEKYERIENILRPGPDRRRLLEGIQDFAGFCEEYCADQTWTAASAAEGADYYVRPFSTGDTECVAIVGMNSAMFACRGRDNKGDDQGRLYIGKSVVHQALTQDVARDVPGAKACILLLHHPLYWLSELEVREIVPIVAERCDILLHGHLHYPLSYLLQTPDRSLLALGSGPGYESIWSPNSYNFGTLDLATLKAQVFLRKCDPATRVWQADSLLYEDTPNGVLEIDLSGRASAPAEAAAPEEGDVN